MKKPSLSLLCRVLLPGSAILAPFTATAAPYASGVMENAAIVTFLLNESADSVKIAFNAPLPALDLGALPAGIHTFPKGLATSYQIQVSKNAGPGWKSGVLQPITSDSTELLKFANGRGVAINRRAETGRLFGRIYVSTGSAGTATPVTNPVTPGRATGDGIYVLNPDFSATTLGTGALTGGLALTGGTESPYRITVGEKGDLFIADWSDVSGSLYKTDGDVANGKNVLGGPTGAPIPPLADAALHGSIAAMVTEGSEADGNRKGWAIDEDLQDNKATAAQTQVNSIWAWETFGEPLPMLNPPSRFNTSGIAFAGQTADLARGPDGTFYRTQRRSAGNESGVFAIDEFGSTLNNVPPPVNPEDPIVEAIGSRGAFQAYSGVADAADPLLETRGCDVSDDGWLALIRNDNAIHLLKVSTGLIDFNSHILLYTKPATTIGRDIAFDAAGNLYTISSGQAVMRVYAPGGHTLAVTRSDGTFTLSEVAPTVAAPPIDYTPVVTGSTVTGADLTLNVHSRLGIVGTIIMQRASTLDEFTPWEIMPVAEYTVTGDAPNFTIKIPGAIRGEDKFFYRVRRR